MPKKKEEENLEVIEDNKGKKNPRQWQFKCYSSLFKKLIKRVGIVGTEIKIDVDEKGISVKAVDNAHVCMVALSIPKKDFYTGHTAVNKAIGYRLFNGGFSFGIDIEKLDKTLKLCSQYDYIDGYIENNALYLDTDEIHKKIQLIDTCGLPDPKVPDLKFQVEAELRSNIIGLLNRGIDTVDCIKLICEKNRLFTEMEDDEDKLRIDLSKNCKGKGKALYSTDYFSNILKAIDGSSVKFEFSTDSPIKVTGDVYDSGEFMYLLAPRIESDDENDEKEEDE